MGTFELFPATEDDHSPWSIYCGGESEGPANNNNLDAERIHNARVGTHQGG